MTDGIKEFLDNVFSKRPVESRYCGLLSADELENGDYSNGDVAVVKGIPDEIVKDESGKETRTPGARTLRCGISVVNGLNLIYDGIKQCWDVLDSEYVEPESRKKLSELYKEIDFTKEAVDA